MIALATLATNCNRERRPRVKQSTRFVRDENGQKMKDELTKEWAIESFWFDEKSTGAQRMRKIAVKHLGELSHKAHNRVQLLRDSKNRGHRPVSA